MSPIQDTTDVSRRPDAPARLPDRTGRRDFLSRAALAAAGVAAVGMLAPRPAMAVSPALRFSQIPGTGDIKVLNYALALEALESELYRQAVARLTKGGVDNLGNKIPGLGVSTNDRHIIYINNFAQVEAEHRNFLIAALGNSSILKTAAFKNARFSFGISGLDELGVLNLIYTAEKTGVGAYLGAIPYLATKTYLQIAAAIQGTEARHTATVADIIRDIFPSAAGSVSIAPTAAQNGGKDSALPPDTVLAAVSPFIIL